MTEKEIVIDMRALIDDIRQKVNEGQSVTLKGQGVSMVPFITEADILTLNKPQHKKPKIGEVYLYKRDDGSYAIHRVYAVRKNGVSMLGDAQLFIEKIPNQRLVAVVSTVQRPDEIVDCTRMFVRLQGAFCMKMRVAKAKRRLVFRSFLGKAVRLRNKIKKTIRKER